MLVDPILFAPDSIPDDVARFNDWLEGALVNRRSVIEVGPDRARRDREEGRSIFGPMETALEAHDEEIPTDSGPLGLHVLEPDSAPEGVYLHIHGGGWVLGAAHHHDAVNRRLAEKAGLAVVSVDYRLAPEHPHPAGLEDCVSAAEWLVDQGRQRWATDRLLIGGESAGAHLAALTLLQLPPATFGAALFGYGVFDVGKTPSVRRWGDRDLILSGPLIDWFADQAFPGADVSDASVSPLYADLTGMPRARFVVGTLDPLLDDSLFMAARWGAAGNEVDLAVYPGAVHAFDYFPQHPYTSESVGGSADWLRAGPDQPSTKPT